MNFKSKAERQMKNVFSALKSIYKKSKTEQDGAYLWFYDNFSQLEEEFKNAFKCIFKNRLVRSGALENMMKAAASVAGKKLSFDVILKEFYFENMPLNEAELSVIRACLVLEISKNLEKCGKSSDEKGTSGSFLMLSSLNDIDFSGVSESLSETSKILSCFKGYKYATEKTRFEIRKAVDKAALKNGRTPACEALFAKDAFFFDEAGFYKEYLNNGNAAVGWACIFLMWFMPLALTALLVFVTKLYLLAFLFLPLSIIFREWIYAFSGRIVKPVFYPEISLEDGVPGEGKTVIAYSCLMPSDGDFSGISEKLADIYLSSCEKNISVCALLDLKEAKEKKEKTDEKNVNAAVEAISALNKKYGGGFTLLTRERVFSKAQGLFIPPERKLGAVKTLIKAVGGNKDGAFLFGDEKSFYNAKYVFICDSDTVILPLTVKRLIGKALHPGNRAKLNADKSAVESGYGIFAPKTGVDVVSAYKTRFSRIFSGGGGCSLYHENTAEFYSDMFRDGIFQGKGLIDVGAYLEVVPKNLPYERVLSHDIAEGSFLRVCTASDCEVSDGFPSTLFGFLKREERWVRGDFQNLFYLFSKKYHIPSALSKYKLADNAVRALFAPSCALCLLLSAFLSEHAAYFVAGVTAAFFLNSLIRLVFLALFHPKCAFRRYFSRNGGSAADIRRDFFEFLLCFTNAKTEICAAVLGVARSISGKKTLSWTVSSEYENKKSPSFFYESAFSLVCAAALILFGVTYVKLLGVLLLLSVPLIYFVLKENGNSNKEIESKNEIYSYAKLHWNYFGEFCRDEFNNLPPDNVVFTKDGKIKNINVKTSPTNIGFYLLSVLAAAEMSVISQSEAEERLDKALSSVEALEKYKGNLYNWYDTSTLKKVKPFYVSSVDSGNFLCAVTALKEGLKENGGIDTSGSICRRIEKITAETDFSVFYNGERGLLRTGIDGETGKGTDTHYDLFMSEMRMTSYFAIASKSVPYIHWQKIGRKEKSLFGYFGTLSWTGTAFEYYMSSLFLPTYEGTRVFEALEYSYYCQKKFAKKHGIPFGISESSYYSFDENGLYKYVADGVPKTALKKEVGKNLAVSPYSSFLFFEKEVKEPLLNLKRLKDLGALSKYGFFDAVDFTKSRVGNTPEPVRCVMAHHVGMSFIACFNALKDGCAQKRFMSDSAMRGAKTLLYEKI